MAPPPAAAGGNHHGCFHIPCRVGLRLSGTGQPTRITSHNALRKNANAITPTSHRSSFHKDQINTDATGNGDHIRAQFFKRSIQRGSRFRSTGNSR